MPADPALCGTQLAKAFGGIKAVGGVDVTVRRGEVVGMLGPNGSGKTTMLSLLAGLVRPDSGGVELVGRNVTRTAPYSARRNEMACALQNPRLFGSLTVRDNLELSLRAKRRHDGAASRLIDEVLERLQLAHAGDLCAEELSGGQRKLVDLARALVVRPSVLLSDEPTAGVSRAGQELVAAALREAAEVGAAVLLVSHDLPWTFSLCERIMFLRSGELLLEGAAAEVRDDPRIAAAYLR